MILTEIIFALLATILCAAIVIATVGWDPYASGGWPTAVFVFGLLFLTIWAGAVWLTPLGMQLWGAEWIPFIAVAFIVGLFLAALAPSRRRHGPAAEERAQAQEVATTTLNVFFWMLVVVLVAALVIHYGRDVVIPPAPASPPAVDATNARAVD